MADENNNHIDDHVEEVVKDAAQTAAKAASEWGRDARKRAEDLKTDAAKQLNTAAETMRREARESQVDASAVKIVDDVAAGLEKAAVFLNTNSFESMANTAAREVKQSTQDNPWRTIVIALIAGFFLGMILRGGKK
ncbi:MAG: hypothetical protein SGI73_17920 [Chloroflexota bacterium]|nr:hypothetical protein [Chloroflexota bacterium]